ncbi:MAG: tetratricopeptide repeat protein [Candidatus Cloacimonetes bacterium]|nr:tetratricopeptide repeat protein [Candidatus Cloacimonadota bacterium]
MKLEECPVCKKIITGNPERCSQCDSDLTCYHTLNEIETFEKKKDNFFSNSVKNILLIMLMLLNVFVLIIIFFQYKTHNGNSEIFAKLIDRQESIFLETKQGLAKIHNLRDEKTFRDSISFKKETSIVKFLEDEHNSIFLENYYLAQNFCKKGKHQKAKNIFLNLIEKKHPLEYQKNILYWIGLSYYGLNNYNEAIAYFERTLETSGFENKNTDALFMLGKISYKKNNFKKAEQYFAKCVIKDTKNRKEIGRYLRKIDDRNK